MTELTPKRRRFCQEYILDSNGTAAAIRAGFSDRTAKTQASQMLDMDCVKQEVARLEKAAADNANVTLQKIYDIFFEAIQIARRKESASGMTNAGIAIAKLAGLWVEKHEDLAIRAKLEAEMAAIAQQGEIKTAGALIAEAAESLGLKRSATPAEIVGALSQTPIATPQAYKLLRAAAISEQGAANG